MRDGQAALGCHLIAFFDWRLCKDDELSRGGADADNVW
jgi:hypothetical protein